MKLLSRFAVNRILVTVTLLWLIHQFIKSKYIEEELILRNTNSIYRNKTIWFRNRVKKTLNCSIEFSLQNKTIVNPYNFNYIINNPDLCGTSPLSYVVYIHASPSLNKVPHRNYIRKTWGKANILSDHPSRLVFFFGRPKTKEQYEVIYNENEIYGDVVMEDYLDSYNNLTYKAMGALKWLSTFCNNTDFYIKSDDDYHVNIWTLVQDLLSLYKKDCKFFYCVVWRDFSMPILRKEKGGCMKWCVPGNYMPEYKGYPTYCSGHTYSFTSSIARYLFEKSLTLSYFFIDDAFITGIVPNERPRQMNHYTHEKSFLSGNFNENLKNHLFFPHFISIPIQPWDFKNVWNEQINNLTMEQILMTDKPTLIDWFHSNKTF